MTGVEAMFSDARSGDSRRGAFPEPQSLLRETAPAHCKLMITNVNDMKSGTGTNRLNARGLMNCPSG
jgi:hypothetical protein